MAIIAVFLWGFLICFHKQILTFFGTTEEIMPQVMAYCKWVIIFLPAFIVPPFIGALIQALIMCTHFLRKSCNLKPAKPFTLFRRIRNIVKVGFGAGVIELGTVFIAILMNNQIMKYGGTTELAIYGVLVTIFQLFSAVFSGVGQAIQPLVSSNYGAGNHQRNRQFLKMGMITIVLMGIVFTSIGEIFPVSITRLFIDVTPEVIQAAPHIFSIFFLVFIPSGITVLTIYYLQSTMQHNLSIVTSILKGAIASASFILLLPMIFGLNGVWAALPCSELFVAIIPLYFIKKTDNRYICGDH